MMKRLLIIAWFLGVLIPSSLVQAGDRTGDPQKTIEEASGVLLNRSASGAQIQDALIRLLDAAVLTLPSSEHAADARLNLEAARAEMKDRSPLTEKAFHHLDLAYRALNAGKSFQFPAVRSIEEARTHIQNLVATALTSQKKGRSEPVSRLLLECVIMVITPISR